MAVETRHIARLPNPPLTEVVFSLRWELPRLTEDSPVRHDPEFERIAATLAAQYISDMPHVRRFVPASLGHIGLSYRPIVQLGPGEGAFPRLQLGPGIFTVNQSGEAYEFEEFKRLVATHLAGLRKAARTGGDTALVPFQLGFALLNRFDLREWDRFVDTGRKVRTKASKFLGEVLGFDLQTGYGPIDRTSIYRQELSQTFDLEGDVGRLELTARDASESPERQIVTFDQAVTTTRVPTHLTEENVDVAAWLDRAHEYTKQVFLKLRTQHEHLNRYLLTPPKPHSDD